MSTFDPFDKKAASAQAAHDREVADRTHKMQVEAEARRKKQLLQADIVKIQQELARRKQEAITLEQETEHGTRLLEQRKREVAEATRDLQIIDRKVSEEGQKVGVVSQVLDSIRTKLQGLRTKLSGLTAKEKQEEGSAQNKKILLANATQKKEALTVEFERVDAALKKLRTDVDKEKKELVQKQTSLAKREHERDSLERLIQNTKQKIHDLEHELQLLRTTLSKEEQEKTQIDNSHVQEDKEVQILLQATQGKDAELYRLNQEHEKIRRELDQEKDIIQRTQTAFTQDESLEKHDEAGLNMVHQEELKLLADEKTQRDAAEAIRTQYEKDLDVKKALEAKKAEALTHISTESTVLQQRQQRKRNVDNEIKNFERELQQKERELREVRL